MMSMMLVVVVVVVVVLMVMRVLVNGWSYCPADAEPLQLPIARHHTLSCLRGSGCVAC